MDQSLIRLEDATRVLAEYQNIDDILPHYNLAEQYQFFAKKQKLGHEAVNYGAEIKLRAGRRMGEVLEDGPIKPGGNGNNQYKKQEEEELYINDTIPPKLSDVGLTRLQSSQFQTLASIPQNIFEGYLTELKTKEQEITTAGLLRIAKSLKKEDRVIIPQFSDSIVQLIHGDMLTELPKLDLFDLVIADPPYNVTNWEWDKIGDEFFNLTRQWLNVIKQSLKPQYNLFWFCSPQFSADIEMILRELSLPVQSRIVWHRRNMAMGSQAINKFIDTWEMIFHCGNRALNFPQDWSDAWFDVQTFAVPQTNFDHDPKYHPTQKPIDLIKRLVQFGSYPNDRILDPFAGSGTTGEASAARECVLIEQEEKYTDIIEQRLGIKRSG